MKRAALYARVSTDKQEEEGTIESQIEEVKKQIKMSGDVLVKEYLDDGYSGGSLDRPALTELRQDLKRDAFDTVYALHIDRLARDVMDFKILVSEFFVYKKQLIVDGRDCKDDPDHRFEMTIIAAVAELERAKILERNTRGRMYRLRQGQLMANGKRIFGYTYIKRTDDTLPRFEVNEHEAAIVRQIFELYAKGNISCNAIAEQLRNVGLTNERVGLKGHRIGYILGNEAYAGTKYFNTMETKKIDQGPGQKKNKVRVYRDRSEWIGIPIPAIVSKELFDKVQERLTYNRECYRNAKGTQLLSNLVFCPTCKERCHGFRKFYAVKRRNKMTYYNRRLFNCRKGRCGNSAIDARLLELWTREMMQETLFDSDKLKASLDFFKTKRRSTRRIKKQIDDATEKLRTLEAQKKRILDLYAQNGIEQEEYYRRMTGYADQIAKLDAARKQLLQQLPLFAKPEVLEENINAYCKQIKERFETCNNFDTWRQFFLDHVERVEYDKRKGAVICVSLHGSIPVVVQLPEGEEEIRVAFTIKKKFGTEESERKLREFDRVDGSIQHAVSVPRTAYVFGLQTTV